MSELLDIVQEAIGEIKGEHILLYDFTDLNPFLDNVIICSASNLTQVHAIAHNIKERVREQGFLVRNIEGGNESSWMLVDLDTIVVHVFLTEERAHFQLERLYADLPCKEVSA